MADMSEKRATGWRTGRPPARYPMDGKMLTVEEIAGRLGIKVKAIYNWRYIHKGPDGVKPDMAETIAHFKRVRAGMRPRRGRRPKRSTVCAREADRDVVRAVNTILEILGY